MGRADEGVAVVDWATLTGRDARWESVVPCEAMYRSRLCYRPGTVGTHSYGSMLGWSWCLGESARGGSKQADLRVTAADSVPLDEKPGLGQGQ